MSWWIGQGRRARPPASLVKHHGHAIGPPPLPPRPARRYGVAMHIAVIMPRWVGDAVMATPALRALRQHFADARITNEDSIVLFFSAENVREAVKLAIAADKTEFSASRFSQINRILFEKGGVVNRFSFSWCV